MASGRESERKRIVIAALRATRRIYRAADSEGERLERVLDRLILRKTRPLPAEVEPLYGRFRVYRDKVQLLERALTDLFAIAGQ